MKKLNDWDLAREYDELEDEEERVQEVAIVGPPPTAEELAAAAAKEAAAKEASLDGRFVQRRTDMQMEARLKLREKSAAQLAGAKPARRGRGQVSEEAYFA